MAATGLRTAGKYFRRGNTTTSIAIHQAQPCPPGMVFAVINMISWNFKAIDRSRLALFFTAPSFLHDSVSPAVQSFFFWSSVCFERWSFLTGYLLFSWKMELISWTGLWDLIVLSLIVWFLADWRVSLARQVLSGGSAHPPPLLESLIAFSIAFQEVFLLLDELWALLVDLREKGLNFRSSKLDRARHRGEVVVSLLFWNTQASRFPLPLMAVLKFFWDHLRGLGTKPTMVNCFRFKLERVPAFSSRVWGYPLSDSDLPKLCWGPVPLLFGAGAPWSHERKKDFLGRKQSNCLSCSLSLSDPAVDQIRHALTP